MKLEASRDLLSQRDKKNKNENITRSEKIERWWRNDEREKINLKKTLHTKIDTIEKKCYLQKLTQKSKTNCAKSSDKNTTCAFSIT